MSCLCACGCGLEIPPPKSWNRGSPRKFASHGCAVRASNRARYERQKIERQAAKAAKVRPLPSDPRLSYLSCPFRGPMGHCGHASALYRTTDQRECFQVRVVHRSCMRPKP